MSVSARANEPSMEEILASIRRIISDDVAAESAARPAEVPIERETEALPVAEAAVSDVAAEPEAFEAEQPVVRTATERPVISAAGAEPRGFARPLVTTTSRVTAGPHSAPRRPLGEALAARAPVAARAAPTSVIAEPVAQQASSPVENDDLEAPFAAALLDLAMVEQAVQAELASVPLEAFAEAALDPDDAVEPFAAAAPIMEPRRAELSAGSVQSGPSPARAISPQTTPEAVDMQVQAKPATLSSRPAAAAPTAETRPAAVQPARAPEVATLPEPARLVSSPTNTAVAASFGALARTVASNSRSVEDVVTEAIRPMLKSWLDENLPALVERLVRAEIERVARQG